MMQAGLVLILLPTLAAIVGGMFGHYLGWRQGYEHATSVCTAMKRARDDV